MDGCLFTIAHFAFCGNRLFAPNGANPCDNLHLELRLFDTDQQHRTDCHENGATKELPCSASSFGKGSNVWQVFV
jgi:hypothetical protein